MLYPVGPRCLFPPPEPVWLWGGGGPGLKKVQLANESASIGECEQGGLESDSHPLTAAVRFMEAHGVTFTPVEESQLQQLPAERMIDALVTKLPQQSREQFAHLFRQLSFIASTTTRLRSALEGGQPGVIAEALESAEGLCLQTKTSS